MKRFADTPKTNPIKPNTKPILTSQPPIKPKANPKQTQSPTLRTLAGGRFKPNLKSRHLCCSRPGTRRQGLSQGINVLDYKRSARVVFLKRAFA